MMRSEEMTYRRAGSSGLKLPCVSLGSRKWQGDYGAVRAACLAAFEAGVAHLDLSNLDGSGPGMAESFAGRLMREEMAAHRDDWIIATRAGGRMWAGAYGSGGSRKHLRCSLDQSLRRLGLEYVDVFYYEQGDAEVPWEEPLSLLADAVRAGKALYAGIAGYAPEQVKEAAKYMKAEGVPLAVHACGAPLGTEALEEDDTLRQNEKRGLGSMVALAGVECPPSVEPAVWQKLEAWSRQQGFGVEEVAAAWWLRDARVTSVVLNTVAAETVRRVAHFVVKRPMTPDHWRQLHGILRKEKPQAGEGNAVVTAPLPKAKAAKGGLRAVKIKPPESPEIQSPTV